MNIGLGRVHRRIHLGGSQIGRVVESGEDFPILLVDQVERLAFERFTIGEGNPPIQSFNCIHFSSPLSIVFKVLFGLFPKAEKKFEDKSFSRHSVSPKDVKVLKFVLLPTGRPFVHVWTTRTRDASGEMGSSDSGASEDASLWD